jgi:hypothetical protein
VLVAPRLVHLLIGRTGLVAFCCMTLIAPPTAAAYELHHALMKYYHRCLLFEL